MVQIPIMDDNGVQLFSVTEEFYKFCIRCRTKINTEDTQVVGILWGGVGSGKSVLAQKIARIITNKITIDKIAFTKMEFIHAVLISEKECIIADEGVSIFFGRAAMTKEGRLMAELMAQIRQKNLLVLICVPDILSVDQMVLSQASFVGYVYERRQRDPSGKIRIIKGNCDLFLDYPKNSYKDRIIRYLKLKRSNPLYHEKKPPFNIREKGNPYNPDKKDSGFYAVDKDTYLTKKASVFDKYKKAFAVEDRRKNGLKKKQFDYDLIDRDLKGGLSKDEIRKKYNISESSLQKFIRETKLGLLK